jgi:DnaJ-class molecular chaperone
MEKEVNYAIKERTDIQFIPEEKTMAVKRVRVKEHIKTLRESTKAICDHCKGTGREPGSDEKPCTVCKGSGKG